jgi:hypothetical protein
MNKLFEFNCDREEHLEVIKKYPKFFVEKDIVSSEWYYVIPFDSLPIKVVRKIIDEGTNDIINLANNYFEFENKTSNWFKIAAYIATLSEEEIKSLIVLDRLSK